MDWQSLGRTCTGGHIYNAMFGTKEQIEAFMFTHALIIIYSDPEFKNYPITKVIHELSQKRAPDLRAICLGPWSVNGSTLWMLRRGPEVKGEQVCTESKSI